MLKQRSFNSPPHHILWWSAISFLIVGGFLRGKTFDIQLHDTYFVLDMLSAGLSFSAVAGILGLIYWLFKGRSVTNWMTKTHVWLSILSLSIFMWVIIMQSLPELNQGSYSSEVNILGVTTFIVFIGAQLLFVFNIARSLFR